MKRYFVVTFLAVAACVLSSARPAQAQQQFWDGCEDDFTVWAPHHVGRYAAGQTALHINRPGCPWFIIDVDAGAGRKLSFHAEYVDGTPSSQFWCDSAKQQYVVARRESSGIFTVVGSGTMVGKWTNWFGWSFCRWDMTEGTWSTTVNPAADTTYRMLVRAWTSPGERTARGVVGVDVPSID